MLSTNADTPPSFFNTNVIQLELQEGMYIVALDNGKGRVLARKRLVVSK